MRRRLLWHGFFLFLLGTLTGLVIPMFANPRMGVSAHLAGAMSGLFIVVLGLAVDEIRLGERARSVMAELAVWSNYLGWAALAAAAARRPGFRRGTLEGEPGGRRARSVLGRYRGRAGDGAPGSQETLSPRRSKASSLAQR